MICETCKPLLSEYIEGRLEAAQAACVETHLAQCPDCTTLTSDFRVMTGLLRGMPVSQTSPQFDARLAARLTQARPAKAPWLVRLDDRLRPSFSLWRPALAFSAAAIAIAGVVAFEHPVAPAETPPASEGSLVTHCIQQHRSYVGAQPLSDLAAQSLANQLDETASTQAAPLPGGNDL